VPRLSEPVIRRILLWLSLAVGLLTAAGVFSVFWSQFPLDDFHLVEVRESFVRLFALDREANVPTWFSSSILLASAALLGWIAMNRRGRKAPFWRHWTALALVFLFFSLDETAQIHEMLSRPTRHLLGLDGALHFSWVVPVGFLVLVSGVFFLPFLRGLPAGTRNLFLLSGSVFLLGSLGLESVSALFSTQVGKASVAYGLATSAEEFLEMAGIVIFLKALMECPPLYGTSEPA
jgi:hypothetical protein